MTTVELLPVQDVTACCAPVMREAMDRSSAETLARSLKAIADPTRLQLVSMVAAHEGAEACVCDLQEPLGLSQPTVSHHLKVLVDAGILHREKRGTWAYFSLVPGALDSLAGLLSSTARQSEAGISGTDDAAPRAAATARGAAAGTS